MVGFANERACSYLRARSDDWPPGDRSAKWILLDDGEATTGYPIERVERGRRETRVYTRHEGQGFRIGCAERWQVWHGVSVER